MKLRALFGREGAGKRAFTESARVSLLALGLTLALLIVALAAAPAPLRQWLRGEEEAPAAVAGQEISMDAGEAGAVAAEAGAAEATAGEAAGSGTAAEPMEQEPGPALAPALAGQEEDGDGSGAEDGLSTGRAPAVDLSRLITGAPAIIRPYGYDYNPNTEDYRFHRGSDLAAAAGQPIFAPAAGTVRQAEEDAYWGGLLIIDHEGWTSILRCVTPRVEAGQKVEAGDFIASAAPAPAEAAEEPHFHVEVESEGQSLDPALYF